MPTAMLSQEPSAESTSMTLKRVNSSASRSDRISTNRLVAALVELPNDVCTDVRGRGQDAKQIAAGAGRDVEHASRRVHVRMVCQGSGVKLVESRRGYAS
jgi:hypothetical protein